MHISPEDHAKVTAAIAAAERETAGEIVTIVATASDSYHDVALHYAVLAMLLVPALLAALPRGAIEDALAPFSGWNEGVAHGAAMAALFALLAIVFLIVRVILAYMPLRIALTPGGTRTRRVRRRALALFRASAERRTRGRTGILIYLSMLEHRAEIVADEAIHSKVEPGVWGDAMAALIAEVKAGRPGEGMAAAVTAIGAVLAAHLPREAGDTNELPDRLIEL